MIELWRFFLLCFPPKINRRKISNLLRYQLLPPSSPGFSLEPLKFSLEGLGGLLKEVPRTLPSGRIWANLINLGSPIASPLPHFTVSSLDNLLSFCHFSVLNPMFISELAFYWGEMFHFKIILVSIWSTTWLQINLLLFCHVFVGLCSPSGTSSEQVLFACPHFTALVLPPDKLLKSSPSEPGACASARVLARRQSRSNWAATPRCDHFWSWCGKLCVSPKNWCRPPLSDNYLSWMW